MFAELKEQIEGLEGIISCKITGQDKIDEIHILATRNREPKRIVRDVETLVLVSHDKEIDHKKISIAQIDQEETEPQGNRIEIISIYRENNRPVYHFKLDIDGKMVEEEITGSKEESIPVVVVKGLIKVVQHYTSLKEIVSIENIFRTGLNDEIVIVQLLVYQNNLQERGERLVGASYIDYNLPLAAGKAFLKAVNRRLGYYR